MATRSEELRAEENRARRAKNKAAPKPAKKRSNGGHAAKSANVVREEPSKAGKKSRMSSRRSKNRAKADAPLEHAVAMKETTPKARARRARARGTRVRGTK
ncbi:MAG: hypothetical protein JST00_38550 [Deltaproteobacteria bacterium]|nr:hypothetical protein [Deltaproteobacteria bacterium]